VAKQIFMVLSREARKIPLLTSSRGDTPHSALHLWATSSSDPESDILLSPSDDFLSDFSS